HEFMHLITFNQKEKEHNVTEDVWLNESRSEYVLKLLEYEDLSFDNVFRKRLETFVGDPNNPLCEWEEKEEDYGVINVFIHYLAEHYGVDILVDSLDSDKVGIESINYALEKNGFEKRFSEIFTDWAITALINDCDVSPDYCYEDENLKNFGVVPSLNLMPLNGRSSLVISDSTKNWSGKWYKFAGGKGDLEIMFAGSSNNIYKVPYIVKDFSGNIEVNFFELDSNQKGEISISDFGKEILAVTVIPLLQTKTSDFSEEESSLPFIIEASTIAESSISINFKKPISEMSEQEASEKLSQLEEIILRLRDQIQKFAPEPEYSKFETDLYYGMRGDEVKKLQQFLSEQGEEIYPEKLVTGNFLTLTRKAVIRFQEKYADEILTPLGLTAGTGYFGPSTRKKINELLGY
ncbi:MAG: peptidoglycan-binding domain-containing protein, partial [Candidatus Aerophobetes bacterium]|nr:peptidoglycan-binding domain-containing protein [Candidatus Aerophobetes bacterium]